jgi:hypothetical protein
MLVSNEDADLESEQQSAHRLVTVVGPYEPGRFGETGVCPGLPYSLFYQVSTKTDLMARPQVISAPIWTATCMVLKFKRM